MHSNKGGNRRWCYALDKKVPDALTRGRTLSEPNTQSIRRHCGDISDKTEFQYVYRS